MKRPLALLLVGLGGCGGAAPPGDPAPPAHGRQLATGPYTVAAGSEKYFCFATTLAEDGPVAVNRFDVFAGALVHHMAVFKVVSAREPEGFFECPVLIKSSWLPLVAGGRNTPGLELPPGAGFKLAANDQVLVQLHLLNSGTKEVTEKTFVNMAYAADAAATTAAGLYAVGSQQIDIPSNTKGFQVTSDCTVQRPLDVFAAFPHMHQIGRRITLEHGVGSAANAKVVYARDWAFGDQPMEKLALAVRPGDYLKATCTYDNDSGKPVTFGESSDNEMCYMVIFYTPYDRLDGCIK